MSEDEKPKSNTAAYFPSVPPTVPLTHQSYSKSVQEAPYRALSGVVIDGRQVERHPDIPRNKVRCQAGLTNRWRLPQSLYSDLLGSSQALKSINMPFNQSLVGIITRTYISHHPFLNTCQEFKEMNEVNWSLTMKHKHQQIKKEDDDHLPPI